MRGVVKGGVDKVLKIHRRVLKFDGTCGAEGCGIALSGDEFICCGGPA
jgi:hypothetical protein